MLQAGTRLVIRRRGQVELEATVDDLGRIVYDGHPYKSPSDRAFSQRLGRQSRNGWRSWQVETADGLVALDDLRRRLGDPEPTPEHRAEPA